MLSAVGMTIGTDPVAFSILEVPPSNISVLMRSPPNADDEELLSGDETRRDLHKKPVPGFKNSQTLPPAGKYGKGATGQREMSGLHRTIREGGGGAGGDRFWKRRTATGRVNLATIWETSKAYRGSILPGSVAMRVERRFRKSRPHRRCRFRNR